MNIAQMRRNALFDLQSFLIFLRVEKNQSLISSDTMLEMVAKGKEISFLLIRKSEYKEMNTMLLIYEIQ